MRIEQPRGISALLLAWTHPKAVQPKRNCPNPSLWGTGEQLLLPALRPQGLLGFSELPHLAVPSSCCKHQLPPQEIWTSAQIPFYGWQSWSFGRGNRSPEATFAGPGRRARPCLVLSILGTLLGQLGKTKQKKSLNLPSCWVLNADPYAKNLPGLCKWLLASN